MQRSMVRCTETCHASLLIPILRIMKKIITEASRRDISCHSTQMLRKLSVNLCKKIMVSADALKRSNSGKKYFFAFNPTSEKGETKQQLIGWDKYRAIMLHP